MSTPSDLDSFLQSLRSQGRHDSDGRFTLDAEKARRKLQRYQLKDPYHYVLPLVASAHLQGARHIYVDVTAAVTRLEWDGPGLATEVVQKLFSSLFSLSREVDMLAVQELAIGINAALGLEPLQLILEGPGQNVRYTVHEQHAFVNASRKRGMAVHIEHSRMRTLGRQFRKRVSGSFPEHDVLRKHCGYSQCRLRLNGVAIEGNLPDPACLASSLVTGWGAGGDLGRLRPGQGHCREVSSEEPHSLLLALYAPRSARLLSYAKEESSLHVIVNGVSYPQAGVDLGVPGLTVLAVAPGLSKNLSNSELVCNDAYSELLRHVRQESEALCQEVAARFATFEESQRLQALPAFRVALGVAARSRDFKRATSLARAFLSWRESGKVDLLLCEAYYCVMLLLLEQDLMTQYFSALPTLLGWCEPLLGVKPKRIPRAHEGHWIHSHWFEGPREKVEAAHLFFLSIEERLLGPEASPTMERLEALRRIYQLWGWSRKAQPLARRLQGNVDKTMLPILQDLTRYEKKAGSEGD